MFFFFFRTLFFCHEGPLCCYCYCHCRYCYCCYCCVSSEHTGSVFTSTRASRHPPLPVSVIDYPRSSRAPALLATPRNHGSPAGRRECGYAVRAKQRCQFSVRQANEGAFIVVPSIADNACSPTALATSITSTARPPTHPHTTASTRAHMSTCLRMRTRGGRV